MTKSKIDMTGWVMNEHGVPDSLLTVIRQTDDYITSKGRHIPQWLCKCSCGNNALIPITVYDLTRKDNKATKSCGCLQHKNTSLCNKERHKMNRYDLSGDFGIGYTSKDEEFWFDLEDYDLIKNYCWSYTSEGYLRAWDCESKKHIKMHRLIMNATKEDIVDHKKHLPRKEHKIDNRKSNLRIVNSSQNATNHCLFSSNTSGTTGVSFVEENGKWCAYIDKDCERIHLGFFDDINDAIKARKDAEIKYHTEYRYDLYNTEQNNLMEVI